MKCPTTTGVTFERCSFVENRCGNGIGWAGAILSTDDLYLLNCSFKRNVGVYAGTILLLGDLYALVEDCDFEDNMANGTGCGAICTELANIEIHDSEFTRNKGDSAGAIDIYAGQLIAENCQFVDNVGGLAGAALLSTYSLFQETTFVGNELIPDFGFSFGTAILVDGGTMSGEGCRFINNGDGRGTLSLIQAEVSLVNTLFAGNHSPAVSMEIWDSSVDMFNCTVVENSASMGLGALSTAYIGGNASQLEVVNSIIWGNSDEDSSLECTDQIDCGQGCECSSCAPDSPCFECSPLVTVDVSHSDIEHPSCVWPGAGNINEDPMFVRDDVPRDCDGNGWGDPQCAAGPCTPGVTGCDDYGDFRLRPGSPAINAGDPNAEDLPATDLDGNPRVIGCPDMGAYEFAGGGDCCTDEDCGETEICCANVCAPDIDSDADTVPDCLDLCPTADDRIDADQNGTPDCAQFQAIPAVSTWGLAILALLLLIAAKAHSRRPRLA